MKRMAFGVLVIASLTFAPTVMAAGAPSGFTGLWESVDCASLEGAPPDCSVWGDGSLQTLSIGPGDAPQIVYQDTYASVCANNSFPATRYIAAGTGEYFEIWLFATFHKTGCGAFAMDHADSIYMQFYWDAGSDTLWQDEDGDGYGYIWSRAH